MEEEAAVLTETSPPAAERAPFGSREVASVGRFVAALETGLCWQGAEPVSRVGMEEVVSVFEVEVTEGLGVVDSEVVGVTAAVPGGSNGVEMLVIVEVGASVTGELDLGTEAFLSLAIMLVGVVVTAAESTKSVHISVSVLEEETVTLAESGTELEIVGTEEEVVAGADGAAAILGLLGVFVSAS